MKPKTKLYAGLGYLAVKAGKLFGKRRVRQAVRDVRAGQAKRHPRRS